jgi:HlyD family type I secretion membrane fusion protein
MFFRKKKDSPEDLAAAGVTPDTALGKRERRLLSETIHIEEELIPPFVKPVLMFVGALVIGFFLWSAVTKMKEVARAPGEIIPSGQIKIVQHLDGGLIAEIFVDDRKQVKQGDILLRVDGTQATADLKQMESRRDSLKLRAERLSAIASHRKPDFVSLGINQPVLIANQRELYINQMAAKDSTLSILSSQISQKKQRIRQLDAALDAARQQKELAEQMTVMREDLAARRLVNRTVLVETRRASVTATGEVNRLTEEIALVKQELGEVQSRYRDTQNQSLRETSSELGSVSSELAEVEETIQRLQARVARLEIRAPNQGFVQDLKVQTVGQVIQPGLVLMQIVPDNVVLEAEVRISPKDIGFVRVDQEVSLRVTSYDYSRFGVARGRLKKISASSVVGADTKPYYKGVVVLERPYVGDVPGRNILLAGMSVEAEILTGEKTLLAYLIKPLVDVVSLSFQER